MKKLINITIILFGLRARAWACEACQKQQPEFTRGITHGAGPTSNFDWVIVSLVVAVSLVTLFLSLKYMLRPGEREKSHIKHSILN